MSFFENVYEVVKAIPKGKVATYGQIAVGYALHANPTPVVIPCHRVVNRHGGLAPSFAFGGREVQADMLAKEGVVCDENFVVDLDKYQWREEF